ncbi:MAG: GTP cyclohydrolase I FolE [Hymenobacteraceae bacterium]|nr:GTP cyclohydrolase I FolE [Hymenobacteraceae bacterium]MDX5395195.1 GTP cyclohydrolase I FolE [Hymenobacteraceae bacterium]MDX5442494.1 GTP cyclohydrolase I FolE [Hymenobacteraceae bacterium]MDX5511233.1 GTP cyclohydrolase I FolE [Hymenobacteraceae bacterium]
MNNNLDWEEEEDPRGDHLLTSLETPLRPDAFDMPDDQKIELIEKHFAEIMHVLGLDLTDDSLKGTPRRVAKMFVKEIFSGLNPANRPSVRQFENKYRYNRMLVERDITVYSSCEHHFVPIIGKAHVAYIPGKHVVGLSKLNRIVHYYARRPQVQERMTMQIANELKTVLQTEDVAVLIEADHLCVMSRGVNDVGSSTITSEYGGIFQQEKYQQEFLSYLRK